MFTYRKELTPFMQRKKGSILLYQTFAFLMEQVMGIEPTNSAWEADVMPLNYTCKRSTYIIQCFLKKASGLPQGKKAEQMFF